VNTLIGDVIAETVTEVPTVLDLGCGVGGTLLELAQRFPRADLHGVTLSPRQVEIATSLIRRRVLEERCHVHLGDFQDLRLSEEHADLRADVVFAVESFAHASDGPAFFRTAAEHLRPGGVLLLVDDFLVRAPEEMDAGEWRLARDFRKGWRLGSLRTPAEVEQIASAAGFTLTHDRDLTPYVRLGRPRDHLIRLFAPLFARAGLVGVPFFGNMIGGNALQEGTRRGAFSYRMLTLAASR